MTTQELAYEVISRLKKEYPDADCTLDYDQAWKLLVSVRLAAQCTDARVNLVTPALFERYKTLDDYANADVKDVENYIRSCGFYKNKATSIIGMAKMIRDDFGGKVPDYIEDLIKLPGVGRKTANIIVGDAYGKESIVVDTHMIRISNRLGLVNTTDPKKIEFELKKIVPSDEGSDFCHRIVLFGRDTCSARKPLCDSCPLYDYSKNGRKK